MQTFFIDRLSSPAGELVLIADEKGAMRALDWSDHYERLMRLLERHYRTEGFLLQDQGNPSGLTEIMQRYFAGELAVIESVPVMTAGTEFQRSVWQQLRKIPCGETITYSELAKRIGRASACRAVGSANGANPISIVIPCHRVIGAQGEMSGYAGGVERKKWLLAHEGFLAKNHVKSQNVNKSV